MEMSGLNSFNFCSCSFCSLHMNYKEVLSVCSLNEKLKKLTLTVKPTYYTRIRGQVQRRKGHSRFYMANTTIQKSLFHIHLITEAAFSVLAASFLDHKFPETCCYAIVLGQNHSTSTVKSKAGFLASANTFCRQEAHWKHVHSSSVTSFGSHTNRIEASKV